MWTLILSYLVYAGYWFLDGWINTGLTTFAYNSFFAVLQTWMFWFSFIKREPSCCYACICCLEDFQPMHLIAGILMILFAAYQVFVSVTEVIVYVDNIMALEAKYLVFALYAVFIILYAITQLGTGLCLVKIGSKKTGVEIEVSGTKADVNVEAPEAEKVGA
jgi:hypothetical protein